MTKAPESKIGKACCPTCGKPSVEEFRPFCSKRCADVDLHRWLGGRYRIETDEAPNPGEVVEDDGKND